MNKKTIENTKFVGNVIFRRNKFVGECILDKRVIEERKTRFIRQSEQL